MCKENGVEQACNQGIIEEYLDHIVYEMYGPKYKRNGDKPFARAEKD